MRRCLPQCLNNVLVYAWPKNIEQDAFGDASKYTLRASAKLPVPAIASALLDVDLAPQAVPQRPPLLSPHTYMGLLESKLQRQRNTVEGAGNIISATAFEDGRSFKVKLSSTETIGSGGSAAVMKGELVQVNRRKSLVALKVFHSTMDTQRRQLYLDLYHKELAAARRLGSAERFILPFLGTTVLDSRPVIISMYMQNGNLMDYIKLRSPSIVDRQSLILQVSEALAFLHQDAVLVHGDLKCENILISDDHAALLADFWLSALID